jgi:hypothetical protein
MFDQYPSHHDAIEEAKNHATPLNNLITPQEVDPDAQVWADVDDDKIPAECTKSAGVILNEHRAMRNLVKDRAFRIWIEGFRRVSRDVLGDAPDSELIHVYNIWPNDMNREGMHEIAHRVFEDPNCRMPLDCHEEARAEIQEGLIEGTKPDV